MRIMKVHIKKLGKENAHLHTLASVEQINASS